MCAPIRAELRGDAVAEIASSASTAVRLSDSTGSRGVVLGPDAVAPRSVELLDGDTVSVGPADAATFSFTEVRFEWSHDDYLEFVSEWPERVQGTRDGDFSEFILVRDDDDAERIHVFTVRNTADRGERRVFFGGSTDVETCELGRCEGIGHVIAATVHVVDE